MQAEQPLTKPGFNSDRRVGTYLADLMVLFIYLFILQKWKLKPREGSRPPAKVTVMVWSWKKQSWGLNPELLAPSPSCKQRDRQAHTRLLWKAEPSPTGPRSSEGL